MPIDFPSSPTDGQIYTVGSRSWTWSAANSSWNATSVTTGPKGGIQYQFSTTTTDADPGNGFIRYNSGTIASVAFIYIDNLDSNGNTQTAWYDTWDDSTNTSQEGYLYIQGNNPSSTVVNIFSITGAATIVSGYYKIPVSYVSGSLPANTESISVSFVRTGNQGAQGTVGAQGSIGLQGTGVNPAISAQTANYTISGTVDKQSLINITGLATQYVIVPASGFAAGDQVHVIKGTTTAQQTFIQGASGVTIQSTGAIAARPILRAQYSSATIQFITATQAYILGDIV